MALRDLLWKEMVKMCSVYAAFTEIEQRMVNWYKAQLNEASQAHDDCKALTKGLMEKNKLLDALISKRDKLKLEKETIIADHKLLKSKLTGSEQEVTNLKEQNKLLSERVTKLSEDLDFANTTRDKIANDTWEYSESLSKRMNIYTEVKDGKLVSATTPEKEENAEEAEKEEPAEKDQIGSSISKDPPPSLNQLFKEVAQESSVVQTIEQPPLPAPSSGFPDSLVDPPLSTGPSAVADAGVNPSVGN
ncbi:uncharacterized protein G2W53_039670 [Senna tora]|uniref:Uncharacterized protein n=1 Tax=Senna tora TaxID=362788 RepID=A0A834T1M6_9FABA|nr:uncharacterized protein G2W53_039670 [Senna tora]